MLHHIRCMFHTGPPLAAAFCPPPGVCCAMLPLCLPAPTTAPAPVPAPACVQREEVQRQVAATSKKAAAVVDDALQLSNVEVIAAYLFGKPDAAKPMPVAQRLDAELAGGRGWARVGEGGG